MRIGTEQRSPLCPGKLRRGLKTALPCFELAGKRSKFGFSSDKLHDQMESLLALPRLYIEGLMTIPPLAEKAEASRKYFVGLRELRDAYEKEFDLRLPQLSMGMTNDFPIAVEEGATLVRVGTAIFGERSKTRRE